MVHRFPMLIALFIVFLARFGFAQQLEIIEVEGQPLAANARRLLEALDHLGAPLSKEVAEPVTSAAQARDARKLQTLLDPHVLFVASLNPESRVKVARGPGRASLQQAGYTPVLVKIVNLSTVTKSLRIISPQSGPVYAGVADLSMKRQEQPSLRENENTRGDLDRFLNVEMFDKAPMTAKLSGLKVEYAIALIYSSESGKREATTGFDVGQGTQDIGFRAGVPVLFDVRPAVAVKLSIRDQDGKPTAARLLFRDGAGHVMPPQSKRPLTESELTAAIDRVADQLPNLAVPEMNGVGAMEICVTTSLGVCDFISAMDTPRIQEWNMWYHILNCGFPLKVSGETDFPCMSGTRVGQGRVYVQLGKVDRLDFTAWCEGLRHGRSYVSDGYAHALEFTVNGQPPGHDDVKLNEPGSVRAQAKVAFSPEIPLSVAQGEGDLQVRRRVLGDTRLLHGSRPDTMVQGGTRKVELVINGVAVEVRKVPADGATHDLTFHAKIDRSSWVAVRHFPQLHTNPVNVLVGGKPIRASRASALWCIETIKQLWRTREQTISPSEREAARAAFQQAIGRFEQVAKDVSD
jgi:hypothetical protein